MKKSFIIAIALFLWSSIQAQNIEPIGKKVGKLNISVDPRMELLSTIQVLSKYPIIDREQDYAKEISTYFASFQNQNAISLTNELFEKQVFGYDAPVTFMLHLSQVPELKQQLKNSDYLIGRAGGKKNLENYRVAIKEFAEKSNFNTFWDSNKEFYQEIVELTAKELEGQDLVKVIEEYFNETQNSYNIVLSPLFEGGYGPSMPAENGKFDIYSCMTTTNEKNEIPYVNLEYLMYYVWHEFGHSFVNPLTDKYMKNVYASKKLFEPIKEKALIYIFAMNF